MSDFSSPGKRELGDGNHPTEGPLFSPGLHITILAMSQYINVKLECKRAFLTCESLVCSPMVSARIVSLASSCLATIPFSLALRSSRIWLCLRNDAAFACAILNRSVLYSSCGFVSFLSVLLV